MALINRIRAFLRTYGEIALIVTYVIFLFGHFIVTTQLSDYFDINIVLKLTNYVTFLGLAAVLFVEKLPPKRQLWLFGGLLLLGAVIGLKNDCFLDLEIIILFFLNGRSMRSNRLLLSYLIATGVLAGIIQILVFFHVFPDIIAAQDGGARLRYYLGYTWVTLLPNHFLHFLLVYFVVKKKPINLWETIGFLVLNYLMYVYTDSKAAFFETVLLLLILWIPRSAKLTRVLEWRVSRELMIHGAPLLAVVIIVLSALYSSDSTFMVRLDGLLSTRLLLGHKALVTYGVPVLGAHVVWTTESASYNYVDSSFLNILINYGLVFFALLLAGFVRFTKMAYERKEFTLCLVLMILFLHSMTDPQLLDLMYNPLIILMGAYLLKEPDDLCKTLQS